MRVESNLLMDTTDCSFCHKPLEVVKNVETPWCTDERGVTAYDVVGAPESATLGEKSGLCEPCAESWLETYQRQAKERSRDFGIDLALMAHKEGE